MQMNMEEFIPQAEKFITTQFSEVCATFESWEHLPWSPVRNPMIVAEKMPSFVFGEALFAFVSLMCFFHAWKKGRTYILVWFASILAGCANDAFFMFLPGVDNFFHAQGTIMLTPRLPLYILFVYNCFMYVSVVAGFQLQLGIIANSCAVGLLAEIFYCVYDLVGVQLLWWTWHDTDIAISERIMDVPIGSSMWVITFCSSFNFLLYITSCRLQKIGRIPFVFIIIVLCLFTTPLMMMQMGLTQVFGQMGRPNIISLLLLLIVYLMVIAVGMISSGYWLSKRFRSVPMDGLLSGAINLYFAGITAIAVFFKPADHTSIGIHQALGKCGVMEKDLSGLPREKYLCANTFDERFSLNSHSAGDEPTHWYSVSGIPLENMDVWVLIICILGLVGMIFYTYFYTGATKRPSKSVALAARRTPSVNPVSKNNPGITNETKNPAKKSLPKDSFKPITQTKNKKRAKKNK